MKNGTCADLNSKPEPSHPTSLYLHSVLKNAFVVLFVLVFGDTEYKFNIKTVSKYKTNIKHIRTYINHNTYRVAQNRVYIVKLKLQ